MLKFAGKWDRTWTGRHKLGRFTTGADDHLSERNYPIVDELDEFNARAREDTIRQILNGHGIFYVEEGHPDNEVKERKFTLREVKKEKSEKKLPKVRLPSAKLLKLIQILMYHGRTEEQAVELAASLLGETMTSNEIKPLTPLQNGVVVLVGVKASNFDDEIRTHPRVVMWDSQSESWLNKELPSNTRAVFTTRWIGHNAFNNILRQARKRHITMFNPEGTGMIAKQVKELLSITPEVHEEPTREDYIQTIQQETNMAAPATHGKQYKLQPLHQFIDFNKGNWENAHVLLEKAKELGIETTFASLAQMCVVLRRKRAGKVPYPRNKKPIVHETKAKTNDVSVEIFDNLIKELKDMRQFLIDTVAENAKLRAKVDKFRKFFED